MTVAFTVAHPVTHRAQLLELNIEYVTWVMDASFMDSAQRLHETMGFVDCPIYEGVEVPPAFQENWRFMERALTAAP